MKPYNVRIATGTGLIEDDYGDALFERVREF
jgi:hypothetical protein